MDCRGLFLGLDKELDWNYLNWLSLSIEYLLIDYPILDWRNYLLISCVVRKRDFKLRISSRALFKVVVLSWGRRNLLQLPSRQSSNSSLHDAFYTSLEAFSSDKEFDF